MQGRDEPFLELLKDMNLSTKSTIRVKRTKHPRYAAVELRNTEGQELSAARGN